MQYQYPLDLTGTAPSNLIVGEPQVITEINGSFSQIIIPDFAPFYLDNLGLVHVAQDGSTSPMVKDVDYFVAYPYQDLARETGKLAYGAIVVVRRGAYGRFKLNYQTIGDKWVADPNYVKRNLLEKIYNPRMAYWDQITDVQDKFPPQEHIHDITESDKWPALIAAINGVIRALGNRNFSESSIYPTVVTYLDTFLPELLTKEAVGLGDVVNLGLATQEDIDQLNPVDKYFTLAQALSIIENNVKDPLQRELETINLALSALSSHIQANDEADETFKTQYAQDIEFLSNTVSAITQEFATINQSLENFNSTLFSFDAKITQVEQGIDDKIQQVGVQIEDLRSETAQSLTDIKQEIGEDISQRILVLEEAVQESERRSNSIPSPFGYFLSQS